MFVLGPSLERARHVRVTRANRVGVLHKELIDVHDEVVFALTRRNQSGPVGD